MYSIKDEYLAGQIIGQVIIRNDGNTITSFGKNPDNTDYQAYLKWLELGNTPLPAENT
jgi:hypothetical protein